MKNAIILFEYQRYFLIIIILKFVIFILNTILSMSFLLPVILLKMKL
ncbi:unknown [Mycoplasma sp. CAG:956]|nr:unknown [Mycoplasma sp. CAG:956]